MKSSMLQNSYNLRDMMKDPSEAKSAQAANGKELKTIYCARNNSAEEEQTISPTLEPYVK